MIQRSSSQQADANRFPAGNETENGRGSIFTTDQLRELYVVGIRRNLVSVLSSSYAGEFSRGKTDAGATSGRGRGNLPAGLLFHLFSTSTLRRVVNRVRRTLKSEMQGNASFHDLAIAHCLLSVLQVNQSVEASAPSEGMAPHGDSLSKRRERNSNLASSAMALGRAIHPLRELHQSLLSLFPDKLPSESDDATISKACPDGFEAVSQAVSEARRLSSRSRNLRELNLGVQKLLAAYALLVHAGLEDHAFESFLWSDLDE